MALAERRVIITHDKGFGGLLAYPLKRHGGVILVRLRHPRPLNALQAVKRVLAAFTEDELMGKVAVVEDTRIRLSGG